MHIQANAQRVMQDGIVCVCVLCARLPLGLEAIFSHLCIPLSDQAGARGINFNKVLESCSNNPTLCDIEWKSMEVLCPGHGRRKGEHSSAATKEHTDRIELRSFCRNEAECGMRGGQRERRRERRERL